MARDRISLCLSCKRYKSAHCKTCVMSVQQLLSDNIWCANQSSALLLHLVLRCTFCGACCVTRSCVPAKLTSLSPSAILLSLGWCALPAPILKHAPESTCYRGLFIRSTACMPWRRSSQMTQASRQTGETRTGRLCGRPYACTDPDEQHLLVSKLNEQPPTCIRTRTSLFQP